MNGRMIIAVLVSVMLLSFSAAFAGGGQGGTGSGGTQGSALQGTAQDDALRTRDRTHDQVGDQTQDQVRDRDQVGDRTQDQLKDQDQLRTRARDGEGEALLSYRGGDGASYQWQERYDSRLRRLEGREDNEPLTGTLYRISRRHRFTHEEDVDGFVTWALQNRPWALEE